MVGIDEASESLAHFEAIPQPSAFRAAEKHYQLHQASDTGRRRRGHCPKAVSAPETDLAAVVDPHPTPHPSCQGSVSRHLEPAVASSHAHARALRVRACPGCVLFVGALSADTQVALTRAALLHFPNAPAATNHTAAYGRLTGLWAAARGARVLERSSTHAAACCAAVAHGSSPHSAASPTPQRHSSCAPACRNDATAHEPDEHSRDSSCERGGTEWRWVATEPRHLDRRRQPRAGVVTAQRLLRKLRWATLGPTYDWTKRAYEDAGLPLPRPLRNLAREYARLAAAAQPVAPCERSSRGINNAVSSTPWSAAKAGCNHTSQSTQNAGCACSTQQQDSCAHIPCPDAIAAETFHPDAAIVNYYRAGDTLCGHRDDVERDVTQPIVSISLGPDAVFLLGGSSKEAPPLPLLLRSGDVLVMGADARLCYHGVPRVLPEHHLPEALAAYCNDGCKPAGLRAGDHAATAAGMPSAQAREPRPDCACDAGDQGHSSRPSAFACAMRKWVEGSEQADTTSDAEIVAALCDVRINLSIRHTGAPGARQRPEA